MSPEELRFQEMAKWNRQPRYSMEDHARMGKAMYEQRVRPLMEAGNKGKIVAIDIETGEYALGETSLEACDVLIERKPDVQLWCERIGYRGVFHFGRGFVRITECQRT